MLILNTPLSVKTGLRPELAAYKTPMAFMRPKSVSEYKQQHVLYDWPRQS